MSSIEREYSKLAKVIRLREYVAPSAHFTRLGEACNCPGSTVGCLQSSSSTKNQHFPNVLHQFIHTIYIYLYISFSHLFSLVSHDSVMFVFFVTPNKQFVPEVSLQQVFVYCFPIGVVFVFARSVCILHYMVEMVNSIVY